MDYDKTKMHETYVASRQLSGDTGARWMKALAEFLPSGDEDLTILDLGAGTGRFSPLLAEAFGAKVIGVEPSEKMRTQAQANASHPRVTYVAGYCDAIPADDASFDAVFLSMVLHHFPDIPAACREVSRVLRPGGLVFVRNDFKNRYASAMMYSYFPATEQINEARMPDMEETRMAFEEAGMPRLAHRVVTQQIDPSLQAHYERTRLRGVSTLHLISDEEFNDGIEAMRQAAQAETEPKPVMEDIDLLVFHKEL